MQVTILNNSRCHDLFKITSVYPLISRDMFCAGTEDGSADTCSVSMPTPRGSPCFLTQGLRALSMCAINLSSGFVHAKSLTAFNCPAEKHTSHFPFIMFVFIPDPQR